MNPSVSPEVPHDDLEAYVRAALQLQGYAGDEAFFARVLAQFKLIQSSAGPCLAVPLALEDEPAAAFRP